MRINAVLKMHNVGQGLFFSGNLEVFEKISSNIRTSVNFIFDCGSERRKYLEKIIDIYLTDTLINNNIDLLMISHFDYDHVSGLSHLLENSCVDTVILPYIAPDERLVFALVSLNRPDWYYDFLAYPVRYLVDKGVKHIIFLEGGIGEEEPPPKADSGSQDHVYTEFSFKKKIDISNLGEELNSNKTSEILRKESELKAFVDEGKLLFKNHSGYILVLGGVGTLDFSIVSLIQKNLRTFIVVLMIFMVEMT